MAIVYVVDDFSNVVASILRELKVVPADVVGFTSAFAALAAIEDRPPDVLVTDLLMPEMSGVELAWQIRRQNPRLASIVMSTTESEVVETLADVPGLVATIQKPWVPGSIATLVRSALTSA